MKKVEFVVSGAGVSSLYSDEAEQFMRGVSGKPSICRISHVDPVTDLGSPYYGKFAIYWQAPFRELFGDVTYVNECGNSFGYSKVAAERCEVAMINKRLAEVSRLAAEQET